MLLSRLAGGRAAQPYKETDLGDHLLNESMPVFQQLARTTLPTQCVCVCVYCGRRNDAAHDLAVFVFVVIPNAHEVLADAFWVCRFPPLPLSGL